MVVENEEKESREHVVLPKDKRRFVGITVPLAKAPAGII